MDFLKKARSQVTVAAKDIKNVAQQVQRQYSSQPQSYGYPQQQNQQYAPQQSYVPQYNPSAQNGNSQHHQQQQPPQQQQYHQSNYQQQYPPQQQPPQQQYHQPNYQQQYPAQQQQMNMPTNGYQQPQMTYQQHPPPPSHTGVVGTYQQNAHQQTYSPAPQQLNHSQPPAWNQGVSQNNQWNQNPVSPVISSQHGPLSTSAVNSAPPTQINFVQSPAVAQTRSIPVVSTTKCAAIESILTDYVQFYVLESSLRTQPGRPEIPETALTICHHCFHTEIAPHHDLAARFLPLQTDTDESRISHRESICHFSFPSIRQTFYQQCFPHRSLSPLIEYLNILTAMPQCPGPETGNDTDWYAVDKDPKGFACCPTCFQLYIKNTVFEHRFVRNQGTPEWQWICDVAIRGLMYRVLVAELGSSHPNADRLAAKARERLALPDCPGEGNAIAPAGCTEARYVHCGDKGCICSGCFQDYVAGSNMEKHFPRCFPLEGDDIGRAACDLSCTYSKFAMKVAIKRGGDMDAWFKPVSLLSSLPPCVGLKGIDEDELQNSESQWYHHREYPGIEVCSRCYHTAIELFGAAHLFTPLNRPLRSGVIRLCYLTTCGETNFDLADEYSFENTLSFRGKLLRKTLVHGWMANDGEFKGVKIVVKGMSTWTPPCTGQERHYKAINGRKWFGHFKADANDLTLAMCEECWLNFVHATPLESFLSTDMAASANQLPEGFHCNVYSKKAKSVLKETCQRGDWSHFVQYWNERNEVKSRYDAVSDRFKQLIELRNREQEAQMAQATIGLMQQLNANQNAIIAGIGGSVSTAANSTYNYSYGNSTIGYHYTPGGANAAQAWHDAANMPKPSLANFQSTGNVTQDTENMLQIYNRVRAEWLAIE